MSPKGLSFPRAKQLLEWQIQPLASFFDGAWKCTTGKALMPK